MTISLGVDRESDGTFTAKMHVTGLPSFAQANAAVDHMQTLFCASEITPSTTLKTTCPTCEALARSVMMDQVGKA